MTPIIPSLSPLFEFQLPRNISGTDFGTGYGGTVCGFHTRPCLSIGTPKTINFPFVPNGKLMVLGVPIFKHFRVCFLWKLVATQV